MARYRTISSTIPEAVDTFRPGWVSAPFSIRDAVRRGLGAEDVDDRLAAAADEHLAGFGQMPAPEVLGGLGVALGDELDQRGPRFECLVGQLVIVGVALLVVALRCRIGDGLEHRGH